MLLFVISIAWVVFIEAEICSQNSSPKKSESHCPQQWESHGSICFTFFQKEILLSETNGTIRSLLKKSKFEEMQQAKQKKERKVSAWWIEICVV